MDGGTVGTRHMSVFDPVTVLTEYIDIMYIYFVQPEYTVVLCTNRILCAQHNFRLHVHMETQIVVLSEGLNQLTWNLVSLIVYPDDCALPQICCFCLLYILMTFDMHCSNPSKGFQESEKANKKRIWSNSKRAALIEILGW